jgi:hypothetical protein
MSAVLKAQYQDLRDALDIARLEATCTHDGYDRDALEASLEIYSDLHGRLADLIGDLKYEIAQFDGSTLDMFAANAADERFKFNRDMSFCDIRRTATGIVL